MIKNRILRIIRNESGQALLLVLAFLAVGSIMLAPLLSFMGTGLETERVYEDKEQQIYAADAGIQNAVWHLQTGGQYLENVTAPGIPFLESGIPPYIEENPSGGYWESSIGIYDIADVNGNNVTITIEYIIKTGGNAYKVLSSAVADDGKDTLVEAWVTHEYGDYHSIMDNAITSPGDVEIAPNVNVTGDVQYNGEIVNFGNVDGEIYDDPIFGWPTTFELSAFYWEDLHENYDWELDVIKYDGDTTMNIPSGTTEEAPFEVGPMFVTGDLNFKGKGYIKVCGTIFATGNIDFDPTPSLDLMLDYKTIYSEGSISIGTGVSVPDPGCIVAVQDIKYQPDYTNSEFIFIFAALGTVDLQPGSTFYGSVAGDVKVNLQPGTDLIWTDPDNLEFGLNFPGCDPSYEPDWGILSWKIS